MTELTRRTGRRLNELWKVGAKHALYRQDGKWYHQLTDFPGALFDEQGYVLFATRAEYEGSAYLQHGENQLHVPGGISGIPGYVRRDQP